MDRFDAYWRLAQDEGRNEAPDIRIIWQRRPVARKPHLCDHCGEPINPGEKYHSAGVTEDGKFTHHRTHDGAYNYPSGCPTIGVGDRAEAEAQFAKDKAMFAPNSNNDQVSHD